MSHIHYHLEHAIEIMRKESNYRCWGPLIDALPKEAREPCRAWLRVEAEKRRSFERMNQANAARNTAR